MKVFISWSGDFSREVAEKLSVWIPSVIQSVDVFFSPEDIGKGENWNNKLTKELNDCNFGITCLTPENVAAPWIHFEAGALAKALDSRLSSVMLGVNTSDVKGPLSRFQNTKFERDDFFRLMQAINQASDVPLKPENLVYSFDALWERLDKEVTPIIKKYSGMPKPNKPSKPEIDQSEILQEILSIVRKMSNGPNLPASSSTVGVVDFESDKVWLRISKRFPGRALRKNVKDMLNEAFADSPQLIPTLENNSSYNMIIDKNKAGYLQRTLSSLSDIDIEIKVLGEV